MKHYLAGLTPLQAGVVAAVFILTLIGAIALAVVFRWWNGRVAARGAEDLISGDLDRRSL